MPRVESQARRRVQLLTYSDGDDGGVAIRMIWSLNEFFEESLD
jgi:hypothetical protein